MAFDRTNPAHLLALRTEVTTDPALVGYNVNGNENVLVGLLNDPAANPEGQTVPDTVTTGKLLDAIFDVAISSQDQFKIQLLFEGTSGFSDDVSDFKARIGALGTALQTAVDSIVRPISRAELLFSQPDANGVYDRVTLSVDDWHAARDS